MSILDILEAHTLAYDWSPCSCGVKWVWDGRGSGPEQHRAHVAQVLEQHEREQCYEAWREGVAVLDSDAVDIMEDANPYRKETRDGRC